MDWMEIMAAGIGGALAGGLYFAGLWWTVCRMRTARRPGLLMLGSFAVRATLLIGATGLACFGHWPRLAAWLGGFLVARLLACQVSGPARPLHHGGMTPAGKA